MKRFEIRLVISVMVSMLGGSITLYAEPDDPLVAYNVSWTTPSEDSSGSMPLGNGDIGLNLWIEPNGDVLFYISKTDAWSGNNRLLKLGRVRVRIDPNPFRDSNAFCQTLQLRQGTIEIRRGDGLDGAVLKVWVDAHRPVIQLDLQGREAMTVSAQLELWRTKRRMLEPTREIHSAYDLSGANRPVYVYPDTVIPGQTDRVTWYHRNTHSIWPETMQLQGLYDFALKSTDPLLHRTFGGAMLGTGMTVLDETRLVSDKPAKDHRLSIHVLTAQTETVQDWIERMDSQIATNEQIAPQAAYRRHLEWWNEFWNRSWIRVLGEPGGEAFRVTQGYTLQRFISACAGRGAFPIKFNGSIFTVDSREPNLNFDADYRSWGGPYWFQNTRLVYWPMPASGDFEMMEPLFRMYLEALPLARFRTERYFGHPGAFFPETMTFWGTYANSNYGFDREGKEVSHVDNRYIRHYWIGALELTVLMLERYTYAPDRAFLHDTLLPFVKEILAFYDYHYPRDERGKLHFEPAQSLETWHDAVNPLPEIAGLWYVLNRLSALPKDEVLGGDRRTWQRLLNEIPPLPVQSENGETFLLPAESFESLSNSENPELYAIFPFRFYGLGKPDIEVGLQTFERRRVKRTGGWTQDPIQAALLGLTDTARDYTVQNFSTHHAGSRFPAFWGPNFDWIPDQDHGNVAMLALQSMLMQTDGERINLLPAWPKEWDVEFRLHAPFDTVVEGVYRDGKMQELSVTPRSRQADLVSGAIHP